MKLLAIETSCDETSVAVVTDGRDILANVVSSQIDIHAEYGGVVPEIASRKHLELLPFVTEQALSEAGLGLSEIDGVCVTRGPGLVGALLVGLSYAKAISCSQNIPFIGLHHIEGHILSILLEQEISFPFIALAVSGGHTHLYLVKGYGDYEIIGQTRDDAAGEAFDKVGKLLGLPYPGGPVIDKLAMANGAGTIRFPRPMLNRPNLDFSFSGIKTAVLNHLRSLPEAPSDEQVADISASFQTAVVEVLSKKTMAAAKEYGMDTIVIAGGVACNKGLRVEIERLASKNGLNANFPSPSLCGDNAAMLAVAGDWYLKNGVTSQIDLNAIPSWPLDALKSDYSLEG